MNERKNIDSNKVYPHRIDLNCIPQCDAFLDNGYTKEEMKMVNETRKILDAPNIAITATAVRVPVVGGHSESVNAEFLLPATLQQITETLSTAPGVTVHNQPYTSLYPMPITANDKDDVFVGRIRPDLSLPNTFNFWIVSDNLRKGAATNAVQIAVVLLEKKLVQEKIKI
jgi:aspartate-semialdehyde dehydrogenase